MTTNTKHTKATTVVTTKVEVPTINGANIGDCEKWTEALTAETTFGKGVAEVNFRAYGFLGTVVLASDARHKDVKSYTGCHGGQLTKATKVLSAVVDAMEVDTVTVATYAEALEVAIYVHGSLNKAYEATLEPKAEAEGEGDTEGDDAEGTTLATMVANLRAWCAKNGHSDDEAMAEFIRQASGPETEGE